MVNGCIRFIFIFILNFELIYGEFILNYTLNRLNCIVNDINNNEECNINSDVIKFFIVGDTGGLPPPFYTSIAQNAVASSMLNILNVEKTNFVINLGDNFYFNGVENLKDSRFWRSFEDPYKMINIPWYIIAGNHDHLGNITAKKLHTNRSNIWTYPNEYYQVKYSFNYDDNNNDKIYIDFILIDTIILCGNCIDVSGSDILSWIFHKKIEPNNPPNKYEADKHWKWIEDKLSNSTADYIFVGGHYPIYSISEHGPNKCLMDKLDPLLRKYNVTAYLSGHDHNLQFLQHINEDDSKMAYIVSGAASRTDRSIKNINNIPKGSLLYHYPKGFNPFSQLGFSNGGFIHATISKDGANFTFYNGEMQYKYQRILQPRTFIP